MSVMVKEKERVPWTTVNCEHKFVLRYSGKNYPLLTPAAELKLLRITKFPQHSKYEYAVNKLLKRNSRLAANIASKHWKALECSKSNYGVIGFPDLMQEANKGLMKAIEKFDVKSGYRFTTYAWYWITNYVGRLIKNKNRLIHVPIHVLNEIIPVQMAWRDLQLANHDVPDARTLAAECGVSLQQVEKYKQHLQKHISLDSKVGESDEDANLLDFISDDNTPSLDESAQISEDKAYVLSVLAELPELERNIIIMKFGLIDDKPLSRTEISRRLSISTQKAANLEAQGMNYLTAHIDRSRINTELPGQKEEGTEPDIFFG